MTQAISQKTVNNIIYFLIIVIFSSIYLPHAFVVNEDITLIIAFETDAGSITNGILDLFKEPYYNMLNGYHTKYYGWTYCAINFLALLPVKLYQYISGSTDNSVIYTTIRLVTFFIGLASVLAFKVLCDKIFKNNYLAFFISLFYIFSPVGSKFFYYIKSETTGLLFIFIGLICLLNFIETKRYKYYYFCGLASLVLASLSKQIYFIISLTILVSYLIAYCVETNKSFRSFIFSKEFLKVLGGSSAISILLLALIHPYSIINFKEFLTYQLDVVNYFTNSANVLSPEEATKRWVDLIFSIQEFRYFLYSSILVIPALIFLSFRKKSVYTSLVLASYVSIVFLLFVITRNRVFIISDYLAAIYPFVILCFFIIVISGAKKLKIFNNKFVYVVLIISVVGLSSVPLKAIIIQAVGESKARIERYKKSPAYLSYKYIEKNISKKSKIAYDHFVAYPSGSYNKENWCHVWNGCGDAARIKEFNPDYVIMNKDWILNDKVTDTLAVMIKYVQDNKMVLKDKIIIPDGSVITVFAKAQKK